MTVYRNGRNWKTSETGTLLRSGGVAVAVKLLGKSTGYLAALAAARLLGSAGWGSFSLALAVVSLAAVIAQLGLDSASLRFASEWFSRGKIGNVNAVLIRALRMSVPGALLGSLLLWATAPLLAASAFGSNVLTVPLRIASLALVPLVLCQTFAQTLRGMNAVFESQLIRDVMRLGIPLILFCSLAPFAASLNTLLWSFTIGTVLTALVGLHWLRKRGVGLLSSMEDGAQSSRELLAVSLPLMFGGSMVLVRGWVDTLLVGIYLEPTHVGLYDVAYKAAGLLSVPLTAVNVVVAPRFAALASQNDSSSLERYAKLSTRLITLASLPLVVGAMLLAEPIMAIFGREFTAAVPAFMILTAAAVVNAGSGSVGVFLQMTGRHGSYQRIATSATLASVLLNVVLIPTFGIAGAALATAIGSAMFNIAAAFVVRRDCGFWLYSNPLGRLS